MSIKDRINSSYDDFTESEKKIADYFLKHGLEMSSYSAKEMARACNTSAPTIVRFARTLGYSGLSALKVDLIVNKDKEIHDLTHELKANDKPGRLVELLYSHRLKTLERTKSLVEESVVNKAVDKIEKASCVYLLGIGGSGNVCDDLSQKLNRIGHRAIYNADIHVALAGLASMNKNDVVIAISYSGETKSIIESIKVAKKKGAFVIGMSHLGNTSLRQLCDLNFFVPVEEKNLRVGVVASRDSSLFITDTLFLTLYSRQLTKNKELITLTKKWTEKL